MTQTTDQFSWVPFYEEFADKLLDYKDRQPELVDALGNALRAAGSNATFEDKHADNSRTPFSVMCPFTVLASFNRGTSTRFETRNTILTSLGDVLGVQSSAPSDFAGVSVVFPRNWQFFRFAHERGEGDIGTLWDVFADGLRFADDATDMNRQSFVESYNAAQRLKGINVNLTLGLFWMRPHRFIALDQNNKRYIRDQWPELWSSDGPTDGSKYLQLCERILQKMENGAPIKSIPELSVAAWEYSSPPPATGLWDEYVAAARACLEKGTLEEDELNYKHEIARHLASARDRLRDGHDAWMEPLLNGLRNVQGFPVYFATLRDTHTWIEEQPDAARDALKTLWAEGDTPIPTRIRDFKDHLPDELVRKAGAANVTSLVSTLLMGLDVDQYPPYNYTRLNAAYERTQYIQIDEEHDEAGRYAAELDFLDTFIAEAHKRGVDLQNRLVAQSVVWGIHGDPPDLKTNGTTGKNGDVADPTPLPLTDRLYLPDSFLQEIDTLLKDKRQVIFQGPPGTGKTFVAQELAEHLTGSPARVTLVQFHPSYSYEDFVQGYRPTLKDGQPGFALRDGPLLRAAEAARDDLENRHVLIIDEINRGNIASIFGELYFLLEYRDKNINLQYSDTPFSLPDNLYIIGTMNTADRSIALVDLALRRRFYFVEFHPDNEPVGGVLRRFLQDKKPEMEWVANVVDHANELLRDDRHAAIGPSYFMNLNLDDDMVERIWRHSVLPYIEERKFGGERVAEEFSLGTLRGSVRGAGDTDRAEGNAATDDAGGVSHATLGTSANDAT